MKEFTVGSYRDPDGAEHELVVRQGAEGGWEVLDRDVEGQNAHVVEALAGPEDGRPQAEAIARDYLATVCPLGPTAGWKAGDPISERGGFDVCNHRRPRPGPRHERARGAALPGAAR
jgi:hypothetical protein